MSTPRVGGFHAHSRVPTARCYECGSTAVTATCCLCYRSTCTAHHRHAEVGQLGKPLRVLALQRLGLARKAPDILALNFCERCAFRSGITRPSALVSVGVVAAFVAVVVVCASISIFLALAAVLLAMSVAGVIGARTYVGRLRRFRSRLGRRLLVDPGITSIAVVDTVAGSAELADGDYTQRIEKVAGTISVTAEWNDAAWTRVQRYRRRNPGVSLDDTAFVAGALVFRGPVGATPTEADGCRLVRRTVLLLRDRVGAHPFLRSPDGRGRRVWNVAASYDIAGPVATHHGESAMPVWITPALVPRSDRQALYLEFQWAKFGPEGSVLPLRAIDLLEITVPATWGPVLTTSEDAVVSISAGQDAATRTIVWRNITDTIAHAVRGRYGISLTFRDRISLDDVIEGQVRARFDGNLCQVTGVSVHDSGGVRRRERISRRFLTQVQLRFSLSLSSVRYEAIKVLPDAEDVEDQTLSEAQPEDRFDRPPNSGSFDLVVPNGETVARLASRLGEGGYYIKRVVENPPQPSKKAAVVNRYWDISGRKYDGVYPIDFHIILSGHEVHDGGSTVSGRTEMALSVRGAYTDLDTEKKIENEWRSLRGRASLALSSCKVQMPAPSSGSTLALLTRLAGEGQIAQYVVDRIAATLREEFPPTDG